MKTCQLWIFVFSMFLSGSLYSSDPAAVKITYIQVDSATFIIQLNYYRYCNSTDPAPVSPVIDIRSASCNVQTSHALPLRFGPYDITPVTPGQITTCNPNATVPYGFEQFYYSDTVILPTPVHCPDWIFSYTHCCRDSTITLTPNTDIFVYALLNNADGQANISSQDHNYPTFLKEINGQYSTAPNGISDPDGDSLVIELVPCLEGYNDTVAYLSGYSAARPFEIEESTINNGYYTPTQQQIGTICIQITEYRNNKIIGVRTVEENIYVLDK